jgi:RNA polymerase sigma factor (sigma-70 family)
VELEGLLRRYVVENDEDAMAVVVRRTRRALLSAARGICPEEAEDSVQAAYLALVRKGEGLQTPILAWLLTAVIRISYRHKARRGREHAIAAHLAKAPTPLATAIAREEAQLLLREVGKLAGSYRDPMVLHYLHGLSQAETARLLSVNESTLRTRLQRGRRLLRSRLSPKILYPVLALPWWIADRASAALVGGLVMKSKVAVCVLIVGLVGVVLFTLQATTTTDLASRSERVESRRQGEEAGETAEAKEPIDSPIAEGPEAQTAKLEPLPTPPAKQEASPALPEPQQASSRVQDEQTGVLRVLVVDEDEVPWCGARVRFARVVEDEFDTPVHRETDVDGVAEIGHAAPGEWYISVTVDDLKRATEAETAGGRAVEVKVVVPREGALLSGVVGYREKGPLAGVDVLLRLRDTRSRDYLSTTTDEKGNYRIEDVPLGGYRVMVSGLELGMEWRSCADLDVMDTEPVRRDLLVGFLGLTGVVRDAVTLRLIPGVRVKLQDPASRWSQTDAEGTYRLYDIPTGKGRLSLSKNGYGLLFVDAGDLTFRKTKTLDVALHPAAVLHLYVTDEEGQAVTGKLFLSMFNNKDPSGPTVSSSVMTDMDGHAVYRLIRPGIYDLSVRYEGSRSPAQKFEIRAGENTAHFQIPGRAGARWEGKIKSISGTVRDATTGRPIRGVHVWVKRPRRNAYTDAQGNYSLRGLPPGKYDLYASMDGYGLQVVWKTEVRPGEERTLHVALEPAATLHVRVIDGQGRPVCGRMMLVAQPVREGRGTKSGHWLETDEAYELRVITHDRRKCTKEAEIKTGENTVEVRLK